MKTLFSLLLTAALPAPAFLSAAEQDLAAWKERMTLYRNENTAVQKVQLGWMEQVQMAVVQPCGGNGGQFRPHGEPFDYEFRRSWLTADVTMQGGFSFSTIARIGGLPYRYRYGENGKRRDYSYADVFEVWVKKDMESLPGFSVKFGKVSPLFSTDYITSASEIACVERSLIGGPQHDLDSNWGVELTYSPTEKDMLFLQLLANDRASDVKDIRHGDTYGDGCGAKGEFGWEDKFFAIVGGSHRFGVTEEGYRQLSAQYMHDFDNSYDNGTTGGANYFGAGAKDALSLGYEWRRGPWDVLVNVVLNAEMRRGETGYNNNNAGWQLQPVYSLSPHCDAVLRYTGMTGHAACRLGGDRYITRHTSAPAWADSVHALYTGLNFYVSAADKHAAKLMLGAEYLHARRSSETAYCGWEFTGALRWRF